MEILNDSDYRAAFSRLDRLIADGFEGVAEREAEYRQIAELIQAYEQTHFHFPEPTTLIGMIELKMAEMKLKQKDVASLLGIEASRFSEILNGKRKVSLLVAKQLYKKLNIPAEFILETA
ncbi:MAG: helix-turn-helix domain-containing protein [Bacteroidetes bacterium]|nr:helix-turn-helix domain-containing protein [Fibrella sp.]